MDMNQIGQLLHIHKEALAHGPAFSSIAEVAMEHLKKLEGEAKEEAIALRNERAEKEKAAREEADAKAREVLAEQETNEVKPRMVAKEELETETESGTKPTITDRRL